MTNDAKKMIANKIEKLIAAAMKKERKQIERDVTTRLAQKLTGVKKTVKTETIKTKATKSKKTKKIAKKATKRTTVPIGKCPVDECNERNRRKASGYFCDAHQPTTNALTTIDVVREMTDEELERLTSPSEMTM